MNFFKALTDRLLGNGILRYFRGFRRMGTRPGVRNDLWLVPACRECVGMAHRLASLYHKPYWIDTVRVIGYGLSSADDRAAAAYLKAAVRNPNVCGAVVLTMRGVTPTAEDIVERGGLDPAMGRVKSFDIAVEDESQLFLRLDCLAHDTPRVREVFPFTDLRIGVHCADPDDPSSLEAGRAVGLMTDDLTENGAAVIFSGLSDMARSSDHLLTRVIDRRVKERLGDALACIEATSESTAAVDHTGTTLISRVIDTGEVSSSEGGAQIVTAPREYARSALVAAGAHIIITTSSNPTPFAAVVPTINISSARVSKHAGDWADFVMREGDPAETARMLIDLVIETAEGRTTRSELLGTAFFEPIV